MDNITLELNSLNNAREILAFEKENKGFFERFVPPRGEEYFQEEIFFEIINEIIEEQNKDLCYMYIIRNETGEMVGRVNLFSIIRGNVNKAEIGYRIGERFIGKGYAVKGVKLLLDKAFNDFEFHRIEAGTAPENIGSQIVLIKNGFQFIGKANQVIKLNGKWTDSLLFEKINNLNAWDSSNNI